MSAETATAPPAPGNRGAQARLSLSWRSVRRWEAALIVVLGATVAFGAAESSTFLTKTTVFYAGLDIGQIAIMALPLTLIVITGEIDLSVAAMLGVWLACSMNSPKALLGTLTPENSSNPAAVQAATPPSRTETFV